MSSELPRPRAIRWYFWLSVFVIAVDLYVVGWPIFEGRVLHRFDYDPDTAPTLLDYTGSVFAYLLPSALFGLCAAWVRRADAAGTYFALAMLIGAMAVFCGYEISLLSHLDCRDHCVAEVPSYPALRWVAWVAAVPAVLAPAVLALVSAVSGRRATRTGDH